MKYGGLRLLEFGPNRFRFAREFMEIFRFLISILLILLILRISTGQCFRKERSVHESCMGRIMERFVCLNSVQTDSASHNTSWRYSGISFYRPSVTRTQDRSSLSARHLSITLA